MHEVEIKALHYSGEIVSETEKGETVSIAEDLDLITVDLLRLISIEEMLVSTTMEDIARTMTIEDKAAVAAGAAEVVASVEATTIEDRVVGAEAIMNAETAEGATMSAETVAVMMGPVETKIQDATITRE